MATKDITDRQVLLAYQEAKQQRKVVFPYQILMRDTGQCQKVCYRAMERAANRGLIEYGVSLRSGWITDEGRKLLDISTNDE
ncbi:MAG: hypothetical protein AAGB04_00260 [Pseudomonadota bacterium]